jgi:gluconokinase
VGKKNVIVGLDIGTSSIKYVVVDEMTGGILHNSIQCYEMKECILDGVVSVSVYENAVASIITQTIEKYSVSALGVSTQMYSICADIEGCLVAYLWNSPMPGSVAADGIMRDNFDISGCPPDSIYPVYKALATIGKDEILFLPYGIKEHIVKHLTGELVTDYSTASASGFFSLADLDWNDQLLDCLGMDRGAMPTVLKHNDIVGVITNADLSASGNTNVAPALGDGPSASLVCRNVSKLCANVGSSMAVRVLSGRDVSNHDTALWSYAFDDTTNLIGGISSNGCVVLDWANKVGIPGIEKLFDTGNCMFFPWLKGERTPYWNHDLRAQFVGIDSETDNAILSSAIFKGVAFTLRMIADRLTPYTASDDMVVLAGGGVHIPPLYEAITGVMTRDVGILRKSEYAAAIGATLSASSAIGLDVGIDVRVERVGAGNMRFESEYGKWRQTADMIAGTYA